MNTIKTITKASKRENLVDTIKCLLYFTVTVIALVFKLAWTIAKYTLKLVALVFRGLGALFTKLDKAVA